MYHSKIVLQSQDEELVCDADILTDKSGSGRERPWRKYKMASEYLSTAYLEVDEKKAERLKACGKALVFDVDSQGQKKLVHMDSCRVRLCPLCSWRRSLKAYHNAMSIIQKISVEHPEMQYIFVTLTIRNCEADSLSETLDLMFESLKRLVKRKEIQGVWQGMIRNMEVTHNIDCESDSFDTYHPHFHCLVAVKPSYFKGGKYISRQKLAQLWQECLKEDYLPQVDMRACYDATPHTVAEASKYAAKTSDYLIMDDWDLTVDTVAVLDKALHKRRLIAYSGIMKQIKAQLQLEDVEDGSLVNVGENNPLMDKQTHKEIYWWYSGFMQYRKI